MPGFQMTDVLPPAALAAEGEMDEVDAAVAVLRFLSEANRLRILTALSHRESYVQELTTLLRLPQPLVSYHLARLRETGVVGTERRGRRVYYAIDRRAWTAFTQPMRHVCAVIGELDRTTTAPRGAS
jgi:DNA-binding transcriptional ArsR family regulator